MKQKSVRASLQTDIQIQAMNDKRRMPDVFACDKRFCTKGGNEFYQNKLYKNSDTGDRPNNKNKQKAN